MTYSLTLTITRPDNNVTFLPQDASARQLGETLTAARKAADGYLREERVHDHDVLKITHVWETKQHADTFETANRTMIDSSRLARENYFTTHNIDLVVSSVDD